MESISSHKRKYNCNLCDLLWSQSPSDTGQVASDDDYATEIRRVLDSQTRPDVAERAEVVRQIDLFSTNVFEV
jgi:hypothetical protein